MITAVDRSVLLDVLTNHPVYRRCFEPLRVVESKPSDYRTQTGSDSRSNVPQPSHE